MKSRIWRIVTALIHNTWNEASKPIIDPKSIIERMKKYGNKYGRQQ